MSANAPFTMKGLDHVVIRCSELQPMLHFYCDILGCTVEDKDLDLGLYQVRVGRNLIDIAPIDEKMGSQGGAAPGKDGHNMDHFAIQVEPYDDDAIRAYLTEQGVELGTTAIRGGAEGEGPAIYIRDPEGNTVELKGPPDPVYN